MSPLTLALALLARAASPQTDPSPEEQRLFAEGLRAFEAGDARAAEQAWKAGYAVARDPAFLVRIGEAQEKAGARAEAADTYHRYLRQVPDAADRADIEQRLARLGPGSSAPGAPAEPPDAPAGPGAARPPPPSVSPPGARAAPAVDAERGPVARDEEGSGWNAYNITAWVATAAAVTLLGAAGFFAANASSKADDVNRLLIFRDEMTEMPLEYASVAAQYQAAVDDGRRFDRYAKIALIGAAGAALVATSFFILDGILPAEPRVGLAPTGGDAGTGAIGALTWSF